MNMSPSAEQIQGLVAVALGEAKADLVLKDADLVNVYTGEVLKGWSVATRGEWISYVGEDAGHTIGPGTAVIEAAGKTLIPGLIDGHAHVLHTHGTIDEFLKHVIPGGTTTIVSETLDFCFTLGYEGVVDFMESVRDQPVKIFATAPSALANGQADYREVISPEEYARLLDREDILGVGESNWVPIIRGDGKMADLFAEVLSRGKRLEGHAAGARGNRLVAFAASGNTSDHEPIAAEEVLERLRLGMHVMVREGDVRTDLEGVSAIREAGIDLRRLAVTTDGIGARHLIEHGYMDSLIRKAMDLGFDPVTAIRMGTLNVAEHFGLDGFVGGIAPGRQADLVLLPGLTDIRPECVVSRGKVIFRDGRLIGEPRQHAYPEYMRRTIRLPRPLRAEDFAVRVGGEDGEVTVRVIDMGPDIANREAQIPMKVSGGMVMMDVPGGVIKVAAIDRVSNEGTMFTGLVRGFGLEAGAFAATAAWDVSNVLVVGASEEDMAGAVNRVWEMQGGPVVFRDGEVLAELPLPIAGQLSDLPLEEIAERLEGIQRAVEGLGCRLPYAHLLLNTLTTTIVPSLRISTTGLLDIRARRPVSLVV